VEEADWKRLNGVIIMPPVENRRVESGLKNQAPFTMRLRGDAMSTTAPMTSLSDEDVLKLTELQMDPVEDRRLSRLLDRQQKGKFTAGESAELFTLMQSYESRLLRKEQALNEAVRRGLIEPLTP
jgi:hypothetical protein